MNRQDSPLPSDPRELELQCSVWGPDDAPPLLLLHGITASRRYWMPHIGALADRYRLLLLDLPGFGQSPKPFADYTIEFFVEAIEGFLARHTTPGRRLSVVGHSLGGLIALELAAGRPERIQRLALLALPRFTDPDMAHHIMLDGSFSYRRLLTVDSFAANWAQLRRSGWRLSARQARRLPWTVLADSRKFSFRSLTSTLEHCLMHYSVDGAFDRLPSAVPTLLIHGERDTVAPVDAVRELASRPPHPTLRVIPGAGHSLFHTHVRQCMRLIEAHLDGDVAPIKRRA